MNIDKNFTRHLPRGTHGQRQRFNVHGRRDEHEGTRLDTTLDTASSSERCPISSSDGQASGGHAPNLAHRQIFWAKDTVSFPPCLFQKCGCARLLLSDVTEVFHGCLEIPTSAQHSAFQRWKIASSLVGHDYGIFVLNQSSGRPCVVSPNEV